jgi:hypothetical protein
MCYKVTHLKMCNKVWAWAIPTLLAGDQTVTLSASRFGGPPKLSTNFGMDNDNSNHHRTFDQNTLFEIVNVFDKK